MFGNNLPAHAYQGEQQDEEQKAKSLQRSVVRRFLEFAEGLSGKFIIRMNLWNPEVVQGSEQTEIRVEFSLDLPIILTLSYFFCKAVDRNNKLLEGRTNLHHCYCVLNLDMSVSETIMLRELFLFLEESSFSFKYKRKLKLREHSVALLKNNF